MAISLSLPVRTWATLDAALTFFRAAPFEVQAAQRLANHCRKLHHALRKAGVQCRYIQVAIAAPGRSLLRLHLKGCPPPRKSLTVQLPQNVTSSLAEACLAIIEVQTDAAVGNLLDHEAEELQATRAFLSELRRQGQCTLNKVPDCYGRRQLSWNEHRREYDFTDQVADRVQQHYLRAGASLN